MSFWSLFQLLNARTSANVLTKCAHWVEMSPRKSCVGFVKAGWPVCSFHSINSWWHFATLGDMNNSATLTNIFTPGVQWQKSWLSPKCRQVSPCFLRARSVLTCSQAFWTYCTGGYSEETCWVFAELSKFAVSRGPGRKPVFHYQLPQVGDVCRACWILCSGGRDI